ncbi:hypothetical protein Golax_025255, partial [Gossypium laxum]|nr:hypothetical protein [Gossypium laxum]
MSQIFATLKPGDVLEVKGPIEKLRYSPNMKKHIGMVRAGFLDFRFIFPRRTKTYDILLKQKLDILEAGHPNLKVFYTVDNPTKKWKGGTRYTSKDMVCGPPGMMEHICGGKAKDHSQGQ